MPGEKNVGHVKQGSSGPTPDPETRGLEERNEAAGRGMVGEEPRDAHKAGGGTVGERQGGAVTGRYGPAPGKVVSDRKPKPRGEDKDG